MTVPKVPTHLYLEITTECQLRCQQCHYWTTKESEGVLSLSEKRSLLQAFLELNPNGAVVFTGGEPLLRLEQLLDLGEICRTEDALSVVNTNAALIDTSVAQALIQRGPKALVLSLDSHKPEMHDRIRGVKGTYLRVLRAISELMAVRRAFNSDSLIFISSILCGLNIKDCVDFVYFTKELGVDGVTFQMLEKTFSLAAERDTFFERHWFKDATSACSAIDRLERTFIADPFLLLSKQDLQWFRLYLSNPEFLPEPICGSHERNLWVDIYGNARLCSYMHRLPVPSSIGNVRDSSILELWNGDLACQARPLMEACHLSCGMLNCHRRGTEKHRP